MKQHYLTLDALRGVAAIAVVGLHIKEISSSTALLGSYLAVDFFFALSGFVLAHAYAEKLVREMSFGEFAKARLIRLYPLYFLAGLIGLMAFGGKVALNINTPIDFFLAAANLFFVPLPITEAENLYPLNIPAWSLAFELLINVIFGLFIVRLRSRLTLGAILLTSLAALGAAAIHWGSLDVGVRWSDVWGGFPRVTFSFFAGIAVYRLRQIKPLTLPFWTSGLIALALLTAFVASPTGLQHAMYDLSVVAILFPVLLYLGAATTVPPSAAGVFSALGSISYAIYVLHVPLRAFAVAAFRKLELEPSWSLGWGFIAVAMLISYLADVGYDRPVRRWLNRRFAA